MERVLTKNIQPGREPLDLAAYQAAGGYESVRKALRELTPQMVQEMVIKAHLRGRGGAGFPTGKKWAYLPMGPTARRPKYLVVNADEMEPGTFKDRIIFEGDPHLMIEGCIVSSYAIEAEVCYIFVRGEYHRSMACLQNAVGEAYAAGLLGKNILGSGYNLELRLHASAGRYMCGEETGLLNALEGRRATPRTKPPHPVTVGLWGKPTIVNNVETICCVPSIVLHGSDWFRGLAKGADGGTKIYGVSGRVKNPGWWELPMGTTAREVLFEHAGGMKDGLKLRGFLPGGASTPMMTPEHLDLRMDFSSLEQAGLRMGTGTMIVLDDRSCPVAMMLNLFKFYAQESCGWCTPCREGLPWIRDLLQALEDGRGLREDLDMLDRHCDSIRMGHTFCALAPGAIDPLASTMRHFRMDFEAHVSPEGCPFNPKP